MTRSKRTFLLSGVNQTEVDFVIPRLGLDLPLGIDPFLLYKSRDDELRALHAAMLQYFNEGIDLLRRGKTAKAREWFTFPEVIEIGLGYSQHTKRGRGVGEGLSQMITDSISASPAILDRELKHIEELQLISVGIGADRVSDITANLLKRYLIEYTRKQATLWNLSLRPGVPVERIWDNETRQWHGGYYDLPVSDVDQLPILLVPRRLVRLLPWINYDDYRTSEFKTFLKAKKLDKRDVVEITQKEVARLDRYIGLKEAESKRAQPFSGYILGEESRLEGEQLVGELRGIRPGREESGRYQMNVLATMNHLYNPELIDGETEVRTVEGTERRDIVFTNDSDLTFWDYVRNNYSGLLLVCETKNVVTLRMGDVSQLATYLGDRMGRFGILSTRGPIPEGCIRKTMAIYSDSNPRKVILILEDSDWIGMIQGRAEGRDPTAELQKRYRRFRQAIE